MRAPRAPHRSRSRDPGLAVKRLTNNAAYVLGERELKAAEAKGRKALPRQ